MISYMILHISNNEIYRIPKSLYQQNKSDNKLINKIILEIIFYYEVLNRQPEKLIKVDFNRLQIDKDSYITNKENSSAALQNFLNYEFYTADMLSLRNEIPIPRAYVSLNDGEKKIIYHFLQENYPKLAIDCSYIIESEIKEQNYILSNYQRLVKEAYYKKNKL